jgi:ABC-2 type transport system permease protein
VRARTPQEADVLSLFLTLVMAGLGPAVIPPDRLPRILLVLGRFSPATYAASAFRQALLGPLTGQILVDLGVLTAMSAAVFWLVGRKMDWRQH